MLLKEFLNEQVITEVFNVDDARFGTNAPTYDNKNISKSGNTAETYFNIEQKDREGKSQKETFVIRFTREDKKEEHYIDEYDFHLDIEIWECVFFNKKHADKSHKYEREGSSSGLKQLVTATAAISKFMKENKNVIMITFTGGDRKLAQLYKKMGKKSVVKKILSDMNARLLFKNSGLEIMKNDAYKFMLTNTI
jgi:fructoselysine-6-P-deglycase FrlB-like protein